MPRREFNFQEGTSNKFWMIELEGTSFTVRFGRIGTDGQAQVKEFPSEAAASAAHDKLVAEKIKKGYKEVTGSTPTTPSEAGAVPDKATQQPDKPAPKAAKKGPEKPVADPGVKKFPHDPKLSLGDIQEKREWNRKDYDKALQEYAERKAGKGNRDYFLGQCYTMALDQAGVEYASGAPLPEVKALLKAACTHLEDAVTCGRNLNPVYVVNLLLLANLCDHTTFRQRLENLERPEYTDMKMVSDELAFVLAEMMMDLSAGRNGAASRLTAAQELSAAQSTKPDRRKAVGVEISFATAMLEKDQKLLDKTVTDTLRGARSRTQEARKRLISCLCDAAYPCLRISENRKALRPRHVCRERLSAARAARGMTDGIPA